MLKEETCYEENKTHISNRGPKALDGRKESLSGLSFVGLFILVLQRAPEMVIAFEMPESQTSASKHLHPVLEIVNRLAGLEAEAVPAQVLGRHTGHGFERSTCATEAGHATLHSNQT